MGLESGFETAVDAYNEAWICTSSVPCDSKHMTYAPLLLRGYLQDHNAKLCNSLKLLTKQPPEQTLPVDLAESIVTGYI